MSINELADLEKRLENVPSVDDMKEYLDKTKSEN